jgi:hypothetical protein
MYNIFIDGLLSLSDHLVGPLNVEHLFLQLDITLSDAIVKFQESGVKVIRSSLSLHTLTRSILRLRKKGNRRGPFTYTPLKQVD